MVAERDRHQTDTCGVRSSGLGERQDPLGRERSDWEVVVAGPAEATEVGTAAHHLHEQARSEFGIGREHDGRRRLDEFRRPESRLSHRHRRHGRIVGNEPGHSAVVFVPDVDHRRHVHAGSAGQVAEQRLSLGVRTDRLDKGGDQHLALAGAYHVDERRQRFGIEEGDRPAEHHERMPPRALGRTQRHAREPEHRQDIGVVPLERDGEREDVHVEDGGLRFQREQTPSRADGFLEFLLGWQEHTFARHVGFRIEQAVHRLETQVGHANEVRIGERQCDAEVVSGRFADGADFARQNVERTRTFVPGLHGLPRAKRERVARRTPQSCAGSACAADGLGCRGYF